MSVFDATIKVKTAVSDPLTDHKLLHPKSLSWGAITSPSAVSGTNGAHCDLVHGDQWHEIKGNHNQNIQQNQTIKVVGKHKETLVDSCYQNIIGPHIVLNNDVRNETRLGVFTKTYGVNTKQETSSGDSTQQDTNNSNVKGADYKVVGAYCSVYGADFGFSGVHATFYPVHADLKGVQFQERLWTNKDELLETKFKVFTAKIGALFVKVHAIESNEGTQIVALEDLMADCEAFIAAL